MSSCSIVIPTRNRADVLAVTLAAVAQLRVPDGWQAELVVVDNGSTDDTPSLADKAVMEGIVGKMIRLETPGVSRARNYGAAATSGEVLLFLDDDMRPPANWLEAMTAPLLEGAAATACVFDLIEEQPQAWVTDADRRMLISKDSVDPDHPFLVGGAMGIRRDVFDQLGGFEDDLGPGSLGAGGEDLLLTYRVQAVGELVCVTDARCGHWMPLARVTPDGLRARAAGEARCDAWLAYHWHGRVDKWPAVKALVFQTMMVASKERSISARHAWHDQMRIEQSKPRRF